MKNLKKSIVVLAIVALGAAAAYADCPSTITVESGGKTYSCSKTGTTTSGACTYGNCTEVKKPAEGAEMEMAESAY